jgi:hypothetical protein
LAAAESRTSTKEWVAAEASERYNVAAPTIGAWLRTGQLILLLDDLTGMADEQRVRCVGEINELRARYGNNRILVACRPGDLPEALLHWLWPRLSSETARMRCRRTRQAPLLRFAFAGFRFPADVIVLAVRWYLRFTLSYRDVEELLAERGIEVDHVTVYRWVQRFIPILADAARPCRHAVGDRWQVDETYVKVAGQWRYVYRAVDQFGQVIDVFVSVRRDATATHRFFQRAIAATKVTPVESRLIRRRCTRRCWRSGCQRRGIAPTATPTTASSATTAG